MLEQCGLPYALKPVDIGRGEQFSPQFLAISPSKRMPAIVDHDPLRRGRKWGNDFSRFAVPVRRCPARPV